MRITSLTHRSVAVAVQPSGSGVPARRIHEDISWGVRTPAPGVSSPAAG